MVNSQVNISWFCLCVHFSALLYIFVGSGCRSKDYTCHSAETHVGSGATVKGLFRLVYILSTHPVAINIKHCINSSQIIREMVIWETLHKCINRWC